MFISEHFGWIILNKNLSFLRPCFASVHFALDSSKCNCKNCPNRLCNGNIYVICIVFYVFLTPINKFIDQQQSTHQRSRSILHDGTEENGLSYIFFNPNNLIKVWISNWTIFNCTSFCLFSSNSGADETERRWSNHSIYHSNGYLVFELRLQK